MKRTVVIYESEPGMWVVECPSIGTHSQGDSYEDALRMILDATKIYFETGSIPDHEKDVDVLLTTIEIPDEWATPVGNLAMARAFEIFSMYGVSHPVVVENNSIFAGPVPTRVSADNLEVLQNLGWVPFMDCFYYRMT